MRMLGHEFKRMEPADYHAFAGASPGSWMWSGDDVILIWDPTERMLSELNVPPDGDSTGALWEVNYVMAGDRHPAQED